MNNADFGMIGMAVMGRNLSLNILDHGFSVVGINREPEMLESAIQESGNRLQGAAAYPEFVAALARPRRIMMMIKAGRPIDLVLEALIPLLQPGDIVIDGGNSWYEDTERRQESMREKGLSFFGVGVSGGEEGARHGPSLMPGGDLADYAHIEPVLRAIAAKTDTGACVTHVGQGGAGHFVKMVHNGIEYADMQFIAEAYAIMRAAMNMRPPSMAAAFSSWNEGPLESFLIELTAAILEVSDGEGGWLIDDVLDKAGQKGTGRWTAQVALELGIAIPSIAAAIDARVMSSLKAERTRASLTLEAHRSGADVDISLDDLGDALMAAKIIAYAQGMALIVAGSDARSWGVNLAETARIWTGGCIIRARLLGDIRRAFAQDPDLHNLMLDTGLQQQLAPRLSKLRKAVALGVEQGIALPGLSASLAYYDAYRSESLPQNLTQAQRDAFGAHTYQRRSDPGGAFVHSEWLGQP